MKLGLPPSTFIITALFTGSPEPSLNVILPVTPSNSRIFERASRIASRSSFGCARERLRKELEGVVRQGGHVVRRLSVLVPVLRHELRDGVHACIRGIVVAERGALGIGSAQLDELRAAPVVAPQERHVDPELVRLLELQRDLVVIAGQEDEVRRSGLDRPSCAPRTPCLPSCTSRTRRLCRPPPRSPS